MNVETKQQRPSLIMFISQVLWPQCRYYTQKRLNRASKKLGIAELIVYDQFEDRRVGLRFCTFVTPVQDLGGGCRVTVSLHCHTLSVLPASPRALSFHSTCLTTILSICSGSLLREWAILSRECQQAGEQQLPAGRQCHVQPKALAV